MGVPPSHAPHVVEYEYLIRVEGLRPWGPVGIACACPTEHGMALYEPGVPMVPQNARIFIPWRTLISVERTPIAHTSDDDT